MINTEYYLYRMHSTAHLVTLWTIICIANAKVYPLDTISCSSNGDSDYNCKDWRKRLKENHIEAVECRDVEDLNGKYMNACSPKWITLSSTSNKHIVATYKVYNGVLHANIDYPETTYGEKLFAIMCIIMLVTICICNINDDCDSTRKGNTDMSLCDIVALSYLFRNDDSDRWGGIDYSYKNE